MILVSITVSFSEISCVTCSGMDSHNFQRVNILNVRLPIRGGSSVFVNVTMWLYGITDNHIIWCGEVYYSNNPIIITKFVKLPFPTAGLKVSFLLTFALKWGNIIFTCCFCNWPNTLSSSSWNLCFILSLLFRKTIWYQRPLCIVCDTLSLINFTV